MIFNLLARGDLGLLHAGMSRDETRKALGGGFEEFFKSEDSSVPTDAYDDLGMHLYFDESFMLSGVEFLKWSQLVWKSQKLVGEDALLVQRFLIAQGEKLAFNNSGFNIIDMGLRFYVPDLEEDDAIVEAVYVELFRA